MIGEIKICIVYASETNGGSTVFGLGHPLQQSWKNKVLDLFTRATTAENDPTKKFLVAQKWLVVAERSQLQPVGHDLNFSRLMIGPGLLSPEKLTF